MGIFIKSPFKSNRLETNPFTYGLRENVIKEAITELLNDKSLLITGSRGIGKSSLGYQLQNVLNGDITLLQRCAIEVKIPQFITLDFTCTDTDTLKSIITEIVNQLDSHGDVFKSKYKCRKIEASFSLFTFFNLKADIEADSRVKSLLNAFIEVIKKLFEMYVEPHINIFVDEIDQLPFSENIAHFVKCALETLDRNHINTLSFIFAGQPSAISKLLKQQPAFDRLVKHIDLKPLSFEDSQFVLLSTLESADVDIVIEKKAERFLLELACGYPYSIHILGHEAFSNMCNELECLPPKCLLTYEDVLCGLKIILINCSSRFEEILNSLTCDEKALVSCVSNIIKEQQKIPFTFSNTQVMELQNISFEQVSSLLINLDRKQILVPAKIKPQIDAYAIDSQFRFQEEIFRIYLSWSSKNIDPINYDPY